jgi:transcriptional regulator with XRE-family HTH domain
MLFIQIKIIAIMNPTFINEALRKLRIESDFTQENMGDMMKMEQSSYSRLENGKTKLKMEHIPKIAKAINKSLEEIIIRLSGCTFINSTIDTSTNQNIVINDAEMLKILLKEKDKQLLEKDRLVALLEKLLKNKK